MGSTSTGKFKYFVNEKEIERTYEANFIVDPPNIVKIHSDTNILEGHDANSKGYLIRNFVDKQTMLLVVKEIFDFRSKAFDRVWE